MARASVSPERRAELEGKFQQIGEAQDMLSRPRNEGGKELKELVPRAAAAAFLCLYWVMHMLMDLLEIQQAMLANECKLRAHLRSPGPDGKPLAHHVVNLKALGLEGRAEELVRYLEDDTLYDGLPSCRENNWEDIYELRGRLRAAGIKLDKWDRHLPRDTPLLKPMQQPRPELQQPGWVAWLEQPEQAENILALSLKGDLKGVEAAIRGEGRPAMPPWTTLNPGRRTCVYLAAVGLRSGLGSRGPADEWARGCDSCAGGSEGGREAA